MGAHAGIKFKSSTSEEGTLYPCHTSQVGGITGYVICEKHVTA